MALREKRDKNKNSIVLYAIKSLLKWYFRSIRVFILEVIQGRFNQNAVCYFVYENGDGNENILRMDNSRSMSSGQIELLTKQLDKTLHSDPTKSSLRPVIKYELIKREKVLKILMLGKILKSKYDMLKANFILIVKKVDLWR